MKRIILACMTLLLLSGCMGYLPEADSLEECVEQGDCKYSDNDIKSEGSDFSTQLQDLLLEEEDDMYFSYTNSGAGHDMDIDYFMYDELSEDNINQFKDIYQAIVNTIEEAYDIDLYSIQVSYTDVQFSFYSERFNETESHIRTSVSFHDSLSEEIREEQLQEYITTHLDQLVLLIDSKIVDTIHFYSGSFESYIQFVKSDDDTGYYLMNAGDQVTDTVISDMMSSLETNGITLETPPSEIEE